MARILEQIPNFHPDKVEEASLYLFAVCCGARSVTCAGIQLQHISSVRTNDGKNFTVKVSKIIYILIY